MVSFATLAGLATLCIAQSRASPVYENRPPVERDPGSLANCISYKVPVTVTSENYILSVPEFESDLDVVDMIGDYTRKDSSTTFNPIGGLENVTAEYVIAGTFCTPKSPSGREKTVLLATHGIGYDGRYWDSSFKPSEYSFVEAMVAEGYSIFFYDRLGTGQSQKVSGYVNQARIQIEIIAKLGQLLREGSYTGSVGVPEFLVLVGHSFGSFSSNNILTKYPSLADAAVLTGVAYSPVEGGFGLLLQAFTPRIAAQLFPRRFRELDTGYLFFADINAHLQNFFKAPAYELDAVKYAHSIASPFAIAEFLFLSYLDPVAPEYEGPVLVTTGEFDGAVCGGECYSTFAEQPLDQLFPRSRLVDSFVHPGAGHGMNLNRNATGFYRGISDFLERAGF